MSSIRDQIVGSIAGAWGRMTDEERAWARDRGYVGDYAPVSAELIDAEGWRQGWSGDVGAAIVEYTVQLRVGLDRYDLGGWHVVGSDRSGGAGAWGMCDYDGMYTGLPQVADLERGDEDVWSITACHCVDVEIPRAIVMGGLVRPVDPDEVDRAIERAADSADHGPPPSDDDLSAADSERKVYYAVRGCEVVEVEVMQCRLYPSEFDRDGDPTAWEVEGCYLADTDTWYDTLEDLRCGHDCEDETWHDDEEDASAELEQVLASRVMDIGPPAGLDIEIDRGVACLSEGELNYHLDAAQMASVALAGYWPASLLDEISRSFGRRATLDAARDWQARCDRIIAELDPYVWLDDSVAAGNCRSETDRFARVLWADLGAGQCAVRASLILARRDDAYTRRAVRCAAERYARAS